MCPVQCVTYVPGRSNLCPRSLIRSDPYGIGRLLGRFVTEPLANEAFARLSNAGRIVCAPVRIDAVAAGRKPY
jgi:hypothetical protein